MYGDLSIWIVQILSIRSKYNFLERRYAQMNKNKFLFYILIFTMFVGGVMGIIKGLIPNNTGLSFRHLLGMGGTFGNESIPDYAIFYGILMAVLEIISAVLLLTKKGIGIKVALITLFINSLGCIIAILIGDMMAIVSLLIRCLGIYILIKDKSLIEG